MRVLVFIGLNIRMVATRSVESLSAAGEGLSSWAAILRRQYSRIPQPQQTFNRLLMLVASKNNTLLFFTIYVNDVHWNDEWSHSFNFN